MSTALLRPRASAEIGPVVLVPAYDIEHDAEQVYGYDFETYVSTVFPAGEVIYSNAAADTTGWALSFTANGSGATAAALTSSATGGTPPRLMLATTGGTTAVNPTPAAKAQRTIPGLVVGRSYTLTQKRQATAGMMAKISLAGGLVGAGSVGSALGETTFGTITAAATANSAVLALEVTDDPSFTTTAANAVGYFDDIVLTGAAFTGSYNSPDGWGGTGVSVQQTYKRGGTGALRATSAAPVRTFTGLEVGRTYTLSAWRSVDGTTWTQVTASYTASATSHAWALPTTGAYYWDDVTLTRDAWLEHVPEEYGTVTVEATGGDVTLDSAVIPYGLAKMDVPLVDPDLIEQIDPRDDLRVQITASDEIAGTSRTFDLSLRAREVDHAERLIRLELATDEALLMDYAPLTVDTGARAHETSLRAVCNYVLGKIGASLAPGTADADMSCYWDARNLFLDPGTAATSVGGYTPGNCTLDPNDTSWSVSGDGDSFNLHTPTAADSWLALGSASGTKFPGLQEGRWYVLSATGNVKAAMSGTEVTSDTDAGTGTVMPRSRALVVHTRVGTASYAFWHSPQVPNTVNTPTRVAVKFYVPIGCTEVFLRAYHGYTAGQIRWDGFRVSELGPGTLADNAVYFDGDTLDTAHYTYAWDGAQDASQSTRTAIVQRLPDVYRWTPGVTAWEFLAPLTSSAGLRLFCDEERVWRLIDPTEYSVPGRVSIAGWNATEGRDRIDRNDPNVYCTGVVVRYRWRDEAGVEQEAYDTAGAPGKVLVWEYARPFPGPGAATAILARRSGQGRTQDVTALADFTVTPGMEAAISLPGTVDQLGQVSSVKWGLTDALMALGSRGLTDVLPGTVNALLGTVDELVGTVDSL